MPLNHRRRRLIALVCLGALPVAAQQPVFHGRAGETAVAIPRVTDTIRVDGRLDEPAWGRAAILTGFSQFNPTDGRPAVDSTEALVMYGPDAIYLAVRAYAPEGTVRATLADRDRIVNDDHVQFILDTFNDRRQAYVFAVNPLGVQSDGIRTEGGGGRGRGGGGMGGGMGGGFSRATLGNADLNQDLIWQSKGRSPPSASRSNSASRTRASASGRAAPSPGGSTSSGRRSATTTPTPGPSRAEASTPS